MLTRYVEWIVKFFNIISAILLLSCFVLIGISVVARYFFDYPITWIDEVIGFCLVGIVMLGVGRTSLRGDHLSVDILTERIRGRRGRITAGLTSAVAVLVVGCFFVWSGLQAMEFNKAIGVVSEGHLELPVWMLLIFLPIGGGLLCLVALDSVQKIIKEYILYNRKMEMDGGKT